MFHHLIFILFSFSEIAVVLTGTRKFSCFLVQYSSPPLLWRRAIRHTEFKQHYLDYYDWSIADRFSHPQYDSEVNITMVSPSGIQINSINAKEDEKAKLVRFQITKYALNLFKVTANRSFEMSRLDLKDLNYTEGQNINEFIVKWYLKEINNTRGDIFLTKVKGNETIEVRGRELNNLIIDLLNKKLTKNITTETKHNATRSPVDETLRNLKDIMRNNKENEINKLKIDINKLNTSNYEYLMLKKIKENYKNKKYDDHYINLSDIDGKSDPKVDKQTSFPGRQYPANPEHPGLDPIVVPHPNEYPPIPGGPAVNPPNPGRYPPVPVHSGKNYPPPNPGVPGAFPSSEEMGIELGPGEPGYAGTPGIPDNPRPITSTEDPFLKGLLQDMQTQNNGYLSTFCIKLFELIAVKKKEHARPLIRGLEPVIARLFDQRQFNTFGEPLTTKLLDIARLMSSSPADVVQSHAAKVHYALTHRKIYLSAEINGIVDYADSLYNNTEGQRLLKTLQDVKLFPNTTKTEKQIADVILDEVLLAPYRRMTGTHKIQVLFDSINTAIVKLFYGRRNVDKNKKDSRINRNIKAAKDSRASSKLRYFKYGMDNVSANLRVNTRTLKGQCKKICKTRNINKYKRRIYTKSDNIHENMDNYEELLRRNAKNDLLQNESKEENVIKPSVKEKAFDSTKNSNKNLLNRKKLNERSNKYKIHSFKSNAAINSDYSFEERDFKSKVNDVLLHSNMVENILKIGRKIIARPKNKMKYFSSYSDEEGVLKRNIYKVFNDNKLKQ